MKTSAAIAIAGLGILVGGYGWMRGGSAPPRGVQASPSLTTSSAKQVVVHEHRYVGQPGSAQAAAGKFDEATEPATVHAVERRTFDAEEHRFQIEQSFDEDQPPTPASRSLEGTIRKSFAMPTIKGATVNSLECRASRCRLGVTFDSREADRNAIRKVFMDSTEMNMAGTVVERTKSRDGKIQALIYLWPSDSTPDPKP